MGGNLLFVALAIGAPALKDKSSPADGLVGEWVVESVIQYGREAGFPGEARITLTADGGCSFAVRGFEKPNKRPSRYAADPKSSPPTFDLIRTNLPPGWTGGNREWVGIYELSGDKLTICYREWSDPRPTEFSSKKDSGQSLMVLRRAKPLPGSGR